MLLSSLGLCPLGSTSRRPDTGVIDARQYLNTLAQQPFVIT